MKMYEAVSEHYFGITEINVERKTNSFVWIDGRKFGRKTEHTNIFDTFHEAKNFIISKGMERLSEKQEDLNMAIYLLQDACDITLA